MKLQAITFSLLAALFAGAITYQLRRRIGPVVARWLALAVAIVVFGLSMWMRK